MAGCHTAPLGTCITMPLQAASHGRRHLHAEPPTGAPGHQQPQAGPPQQQQQQQPLSARSATPPASSVRSSQDFHSGATGAVPRAAPATAQQFGAAATGQPEFPAITAELATKYGKLHKAGKKAESGSIGGGEVLRLLAPAPVDNAVKRDAWDTVAGACHSHRLGGGHMHAWHAAALHVHVCSVDFRFAEFGRTMLAGCIDRPRPL